jgi:alcohol dehydrogenase (cytochrome c)
MKALAIAGAVTSSWLVATALTPAGAGDMTFERSLNVGKEPQNWLLHHGNYEGYRFSQLKEINTDTVKNLKPVFSVALGGYESGGRYKFGNLEGTPIVEDGMMYVTDGWGSVYGIDVSSGKKGAIKWKFDPGVDRAWAGDVACCGVNNRGVALWKDKVISIALDGRMFSLNKATGEMVWERKVADPGIGETLTLAPLVVRDVGIVGAAGGEFGIRGFIEGVDLNTGKQLWRTHTIPGPGEPGGETWKDGKERYKHGGGSVWETATYDPESDTFYQGIGNAGPDWDAEYRPGDNKWAASVLALSPADGKIKWGFQYTPQDPYDFDEISEHPIINAKVNGVDRKLVVHAARAKPAGDRLCPSHFGGKNWEPSAYNPELKLLYIPSFEGCNYLETAEQKDFVDQGGPIKPRERFAGGGFKQSERLYGSLKALDPTTGETKANLRLEYPNSSGALATAGNLVFIGHTDGTLTAHDAKTLKEVWSYSVGSGINAPPISYSVNGKQYVAVLVGSKQPFFVLQNAPELKHTSTASILYVFGL